MTPTELAARRRPRVVDHREGEILDATIRVVARLGYERLTMDVVAAEARASKATLYRHWSTKAELVVDAVSRAKCMPDADNLIDTGSLRGDLLATWCHTDGWAAELPMSVMGGLMTALHTHEDLQAAFQERFLAPRLAEARQIFDRAAARDELGPDVDVDLLMSILPALSVHREMLLGKPVDETFIQHVIDDVLLPAAKAAVRA